MEQITNDLRPLTRREHQALLQQKRKRQMKRRRARLRRLRVLRSLRSLQFWMRALIWLFIGLCFAFWARFAFVYDIPSYAAVGLPEHVTAYVTVKPWWFGPPVFDLGRYGTVQSFGAPAQDPYQYLLLKLGKYVQILSDPHFIWILRGN